MNLEYLRFIYHFVGGGGVRGGRGAGEGGAGGGEGGMEGIFLAGAHGGMKW